MKFYIAKFQFNTPAHEVYAVVDNILRPLQLGGASPEAPLEYYAIGTDPAMRPILHIDDVNNIIPNNEIEQLALNAIMSGKLQLMEKQDDGELMATNDRLALLLFCACNVADSNRIFITNKYAPLTIFTDLLLQPEASGTVAAAVAPIHYHIINPPNRLPLTKRQLAYNLLRAIRTCHMAHIIHGHVTTSIYNGLLDAASAELDLSRAMTRRHDVIAMLNVLFDDSLSDLEPISATHFKRVFMAATYYDIAAIFGVTMPQYWTEVCASVALTHVNDILKGDMSIMPIDAILNKFEKTYCK